MAVKIRLKRMGKIRAPFYRVVVMDSRTKRDGRAIEEIGKYHPTEEPSLIDISSDRAQYWLGQGAQPTEAVEALLKITGDWQKYKGEPGTEGTLKVKEPKASKKSLYEAALAAAGKSSGDDTSGATTPRKKASAKVEAAAAEVEAKDAATAAEAAAAPAESAEEAAQATEFLDATPDSIRTADEAGESDVVTSPAEAVPATELPAGAVAPLEDGSAPEGYTVKGNADSGKYHEPDGQWYGQTVAEFWFKTGADAEAAGFVKAGS